MPPWLLLGTGVSDVSPLHCVPSLRTSSAVSEPQLTENKMCGILIIIHVFVFNLFKNCLSMVCDVNV